MIISIRYAHPGASDRCSTRDAMRYNAQSHSIFSEKSFIGENVREYEYK